MTNQINVKAAIGESPNEVFLRTGQFLIGLSALAYLGISGFGVELGGHSMMAPLVTGSAAMFMMMYGAYLRKRHLQAKEAHELLILDRKLEDHHEPKKGDVEFLDFISKQNLPISKHELSELVFPYDAGRTKAELQKALMSKRASWWTCEGSLVEYGDSYRLKGDTTDATVIK